MGGRSLLGRGNTDPGGASIHIVGVIEVADRIGARIEHVGGDRCLVLWKGGKRVEKERAVATEAKGQRQGAKNKNYQETKWELR